MGASERLTVPLPYGQRAYVVSDLDLSPDIDPRAPALRSLIELLDETDSAAVVVVAGNLFAAADSHDQSGFAARTFDQLPELRRSINRFRQESYRRLIVLPGSRDTATIASDDTAETFEQLGITIARDVMLQVATARGTRDVAVAAGCVDGAVAVLDPSLDGDVELLDDPSALQRFAASRFLYRRLSKWMWFPIWGVIILDLAGSIVATANHVTHHHWHLRRTHLGNPWSDVLFNLIIIAAFEALLAAIAAYVVGRRFRHVQGDPDGQITREPLELTKIDGVDALEFARRVAERGGAGAVVGGAPSLALAFMDRGVCAAPGPSRTTIIERRARFGLPPVFTAVERYGIVEIEAATSVRVRLIAAQWPATSATRLERWLASTPRHGAPGPVADTVASWPTGDPWPQDPSRFVNQRRQRTIRRVASGLLLLTGLADVAVAVAPPLRGRLHNALSILPVGVVQGAAAVTAIAGVAMIMMARGVRRGQRRAWAIAVIMLLVTVATHLVRGGSPFGSLLAVVVLGILLFERENFAAGTDRTSLRQVSPRLLLIAAIAVVGATVGIVFTNLHHHSMPPWQMVMLACTERLAGITAIKLPDRVEDFVDPALLAVGISLILTALYMLTRPVVDRRLSQQASTTERRLAELRARDIVRRHGRGTLDYFALRDDKQFFFHRDSLVAYAVYGGVALLSPDPIGPDAERSEVFSSFRAYVESRGWTVGVIGASEEWLSIYQAAGLHHIYVGDEAVVDCQTFSLQGGKMKGLRQACTRLARNGYAVEFHDPATIDPAEINRVLDLIAKLRRGEGERGFSMMLGRLFNPKDQGLLLTIVKDPDGNPAAVCQFVPSPAINGYSLDLMRRDPGDHPNGLLDYALCSTIEYLKEHGGHGLSMNFAAFRSVLDGERGDGTLTKIERWALKRLSGVLPIESLWSFNAKYDPNWLPRYLVYPAAESFVPVVAAILRAESITEIPVIGRLLASDPSNRPGTVVPDEVLELARHADMGH